MATIRAPLQIFLRPPFLEALRRYAEGRGIGVPEAAVQILTENLDQFLEESEADQAVAERDLISIVDDMVRTRRDADDWGDDVTREIFEAIDREHRALYDRAIARHNLNRINRVIGSRIRSGLGAVAKLRNGRPALVQMPRRSSALILAYTQLERASEAGPSES